MKNNTHCGSEFPGMNEYSNVVINADEIRDVVKKFDRQTETGRVFFPGDEPFAMKCETLLNNAASEVDWLSVSEMSFSATDKVLYSKDDQPKVVSVGESDIIALIDNTKKGLFGNLAKKACAEGSIITTKGVLAYRLREGKLVNGFATWRTIAVSCDGGNGWLFKPKSKPTSVNREFPCGWYIIMPFYNFPEKKRERSEDELGRHLWLIARGKGANFDYDDWAPEAADE